ncbi:hypothetical protein NQ315_012418 [Exocentrus adspersus]|uniref:Retrotransposon gag domain-containing protein n=1 Tax=Exocentrus adspersus TaxID=1586481 RepID=A0AAV8VNG9_9CUCU|nr:hypothetical protein NQ315_012418 [Exocentrus adspersus]
MGSDWCSYEERMDQYFVANYIEDDKKVPVLLTVIGEQAYEVLKGLCDPDLPKTKSYPDLCKLLREQFSKKVSVFKERIEFYELRQFENESIKAFYIRLKSKAIECKFGANLNDILRDKFVAGLRRGRILDRVCEEEHTASLETIVQTALKKEAALVSSTSASPLNKLNLKTMRKFPESMGRAGVNHFKEGKVKASTSQREEKGTQGEASTETMGQKKHLLKCNHYGGNSNSIECIDFMEMNFVREDGHVKPDRIEMLVNDKLITMELDSGAGISVIPENVYNRNFSDREFYAKMQYKEK